ncbi:MAG: hypothetical protein AVDCRST_MAG20-2291, partial [uncultured Acidimicrobiales bacterium]
DRSHRHRPDRRTAAPRGRAAAPAAPRPDQGAGAHRSPARAPRRARARVRRRLRRPDDGGDRPAPELLAAHAVRTGAEPGRARADRGRPEPVAGGSGGPGRHRPRARPPRCAACLPGGSDGGREPHDRGLLAGPGGGGGGPAARRRPQRVPVRGDEDAARPGRGARGDRRRRHHGSGTRPRRARQLLLPACGDPDAAVVAEGGSRRGRRPRAARVAHVEGRTWPM